MDPSAVRDAYAEKADRYIALVADAWRDDEDMAMVRRHLTGLDGPVLDLGCGPGHWTGYLHDLGADVTGVDLVPAFVAHARAHHPQARFLLGSMTELDAAEHSVAGVLAWYSTIHLPPPALDQVLLGFRRLLVPSGRLVLGFFDSEDEVALFDHGAHPAWRWPVDAMAARLAAAGFVEVERRQQRSADRPDRRYAALIARAA